MRVRDFFLKEAKVSRSDRFGMPRSQSSALLRSFEHDIQMQHSIVNLLDAYNLLVPSLVCKEFRSWVRIRCENEDIKTNIAVICSTVERFCWVSKTYPVHEQPPWMTRWDHATSYSIAMYGTLKVLEWAVERNNCPLKTSCEYRYPIGICAIAAERGDFEMLKWGREQGGEWDVSTCSSAAAGGQLEMLQYLYHQDCPLNRQAHFEWGICTLAAGNGDLAMLKWGREQGCEWDYSTSEAAAENGHVSMLQYLASSFVEGSIAEDPQELLYKAVIGGQVAVLQWAHANGFSFLDERGLCWDAAESGHLETLKWLRSIDVPWHNKAKCEKDAQDYPQIVQWIASQEE